METMITQNPSEGVSIEDIQALKYFMFANIISADNEDYSEEVKQEVIHRYNVYENFENKDWDYILDPLGEDKERYMKILGS